MIKKKCLSIPSGTFRYRFTTPGAFYYSSGYIDDANVKTLQGVVKVIPRVDESKKISVRVGGMEARHVTGGKRADVDKIHPPVDVKLILPR